MHICGTDEKYIDAVIEHINHKIYPFDGSTSNTLTTIFDAISFQNKPLHREIIIEDYFLDKPKTFRYVKKNTYQNFIESIGLKLKKKSTRINITNSTWPVKVTNSKTKLLHLEQKMLELLLKNLSLTHSFHLYQNSC